MAQLDIYGIGNPLIDIVVQAMDGDIEALGLDKGIMRLVDLDERGKILDHVKDRQINYSCGGSAPNMSPEAALGSLSGSTWASGM